MRPSRSPDSQANRRPPNVRFIPTFVRSRKMSCWPAELPNSSQRRQRRRLPYWAPSAGMHCLRNPEQTVPAGVLSGATTDPLGSAALADKVARPPARQVLGRFRAPAANRSPTPSFTVPQAASYAVSLKYSEAGMNSGRQVVAVLNIDGQGNNWRETVVTNEAVLKLLRFLRKYPQSFARSNCAQSDTAHDEVCVPKKRLRYMRAALLRLLVGMGQPQRQRARRSSGPLPQAGGALCAL